MKTLIHRADSRGGGDYGWLKTRYSFSFANWQDAERMGFGALRVLNDDHIEAGQGFDPHQHADMEIVTIVTKGAVAHTDSGGGTGTVSVGEAQAMSAGTGVTHAEYNASQTEALELFQLWILPKTRSIAPRYETKSFNTFGTGNGLVRIAGPDGTPDVLQLNQDAYISIATIDAEHPLVYQFQGEGTGTYVFVVAGTLSTADTLLGPRDAVGVWDTDQISLETSDQATALVIEVPV